MYEKEIKVAIAWQQARQLSSGAAFVYRGEVVGWSDIVPNARAYSLGTLSIMADGSVFENDQDAGTWTSVLCPDADAGGK